MPSFEQKNFEYKQPDEIIIEDSASVNLHSQEDSRKQESFQSDQFKQQKTPISLRFICFLGLVFCIIFGLGMLFFSLISSLFVLITIFQSKKINSACYHFWKLYVNAVVAGVGFILGLIVPPIGLGFLLLYFSMIGETLDSNILTKILKKSFKF